MFQYLFWMQQLQLRETNSTVGPAVKRMTVFHHLVLCKSMTASIETNTFGLRYFPSSHLKMTCHDSTLGRLSFNHWIDQFLLPIKVFIAAKSVCCAKSNLQAGCYIAPCSWKVSGVFKALSCLDFLSSYPAGHTILSQQGSSHDVHLTRKDVISFWYSSSGELPYILG